MSSKRARQHVLSAAADQASSTAATAAASVDLIKIHQDRMDELEHRRDYELPETKDLVAKFKLVLRDEAKLTDAMACAVFKDHDLLRNARLKERALKKQKRGENSFKKPGEDEDENLVDDEAYEDIQTRAKEHINFLRRLNKKSASKLTRDQILAIEDYIVKKEAWIAEVESDAEYIEYVFKAIPIVEEYQRESERLQSYLNEENKELEQQAIDEARRRRKFQKALPAGEDAAPLALPPPPTTAAAATDEETTFTGKEIVPAHDSPQSLDLVPVQKLHLSGATLDGCIVESDAFSRMKQIVSEYCYSAHIPDISGTSLKIVDPTFCQKCSAERIINAKEAIMSCPVCGDVVPYSDMSLKSVPFGETVNAPKSKGTYEKKTYKDKWMKMVAGELNGDIPDEDWKTIYLECTGRRWQTVNKLMIRRILRTLNMTQYYDYVPAITNEFNNVPLIKWTKEESETVDKMFDEAVILFDACPDYIKQRSNFISYSYFFYQVCTMQGWLEYRAAFQLLCGRENHRRHDRIWEWMCNNKAAILGGEKWTFYPTA